MTYICDRMILPQIHICVFYVYSLFLQTEDFYMTDNEQLLIISNMLDKKLSPLELRMEFIERRLDRLEDHLTRQIKLLDLKIDYLSKKK